MIDWNPVRVTPPAGWLLTYRKGESRTSMACHLGDGEWSDAEGRTTVTHSTFLPPTHWAYLPEPPEEAMILPGDVVREPGPEPEVTRLRAQLAAAEQRAERAERRYRFLAPIIEYRREADTREMQIACALAEGVELDKAIDDAMAIEEAEQKAERQAAKRRAGCPECRGKGWVLHPDPEARTLEQCGCTISAPGSEQPTNGGAHG